MQQKWLLFVTCLNALFTGNSQAAVLLSESFSYSDGALVAVSEGRWKTHSGTAGQAQAVSGALILSQKRSEDVSIPLASTPITATNYAALYAGFTVNFTALPSGSSGGYFAHFKDATATTGLRCRLFVCTNGAATGAFRFGISAGTNAATGFVPQDCRLGVRYRIVCRLDLSNNASTLWLNPRTERDPGVSAADTPTVKSVTAFGFRESLASGSGMGELSVDDLVVATTFNEVLRSGAPSIRAGPLPQSVPTGADVQFTVEADGSEPLSYQWLFNGFEIPGATDPILSLTSVALESAGEYQVTVSNEEGTVTSEAVSLQVWETLPAVRIALEPAVGVRLSWFAEPERTYSVWASDSILDNLAPIQSALWFETDAGFYAEAWSGTAQRFYRVCSP